MITTPFSFVASANCLMYKRSGRCSSTSIRRRAASIRPASRRRSRRARVGILSVDVFGVPADWAALEQIARHGLQLLTDSCESLGSSRTVDGRRVRAGESGVAGAFAFYPNKQITTGEGGAVVTDDDRVAAACQSMRNQGRDPGAGWLQHARLGFNFRLSELNAALGTSQLARLEQIRERRAAVAARYDALLEPLQGRVATPRVPAGATVSWFVYVVELAAQFRGRRTGPLPRGAAGGWHRLLELLLADPPPALHRRGAGPSARRLPDHRADRGAHHRPAVPHQSRRRRPGAGRRGPDPRSGPGGAGHARRLLASRHCVPCVTPAAGGAVATPPPSARATTSATRWPDRPSQSSGTRPRLPPVAWKSANAAADRAGSAPTSVFVPSRDGDRPLGVVAQGQARNAERRRLLLDAARVGQHEPALSPSSARKSQVAERRRSAQARRRAAHAELLAAASRVRGWTGKTTGSRAAIARQRARAAPRRRRRIVHVRRPVQRQHGVAARLEAERRRATGESAAPLAVAQQRVDHDVADEMDRARGDALARAGSRRASARRRQQAVASRSVTMRLISSGIVRSKLRRPASTCATRMPSLAATSAPASVEFTSPTTTTRSGRSLDDDRLEARA